MCAGSSHVPSQSFLLQAEQVKYTLFPSSQIVFQTSFNHQSPWNSYQQG